MRGLLLRSRALLDRGMTLSGLTMVDPFGTIGVRETSPLAMFLLGGRRGTRSLTVEKWQERANARTSSKHISEMSAI
jgi:hypothetical protein